MSAGTKTTVEMARVFCSVLSARRLGTPCRYLPLMNLYISSGCNSQCVTCDSWKREAPPHAELSTGEILALRPAMQRLGVLLVSIGGGEPTLRDDLETVIAGFRESGVAVHINTNALKLDGGRVKSLVEAGLNVAYISCDHIDREGYKSIRGVDGLDRALEAVRLFRSGPKPIAVGINITVSSLNQRVLEPMVNRFAEMGVQKIQFNPVHRNSGLLDVNLDEAEFARLVPEDIPSLKTTLRRLAAGLRKRHIATNSDFYLNRFENAYLPRRAVPCFAGYLFVNISPFGEVSACYQCPPGPSVRDVALDEIFTARHLDGQREFVSRCRAACMDTGGTETSLRFYPPYLLSHPMEIYRQTNMHLS